MAERRTTLWLPRTRRRSASKRRLGRSSIPSNGQDDVSHLLLGLDVPCCLDHVHHWVAPIDDRPVLAGLDECLEDEDVLLGLSRRDLEQHPFAFGPPGRQGPDEIREPVSW